MKIVNDGHVEIFSTQYKGAVKRKNNSSFLTETAIISRNQ